MTSSWFKGLSSILSRRNNKKKVALRQTSKLHRDLYLEPLETRLNPSNVSFSSGNLNIWFNADPVNTTITINNNAADGVASSVLTLTTNSSTGWVNGDPTTSPLSNLLSNGPPASYVINPLNNKVLRVFLDDSSFGTLTDINFRSTQTGDYNVLIGNDGVNRINLTNINVTTNVAGSGYITGPSTGAGTISITGNAGTGNGAAAYSYIGFPRLQQSYTIVPGSSTTAYSTGDTVRLINASNVIVNSLPLANQITAAVAEFTSPTTFKILNPGAYLTLQPSGGQIGSAQVNFPGVGYTVAPITDGNAVGLSLDTPGNGYRIAPTTANGGIVISGPPGTGAIYTSILSLTTLNIAGFTSPGSGYKVNDIVSIDTGTTPATFRVAQIDNGTTGGAGAITGISNLVTGYGYTSLNNLDTTAITGTGSGARVSATGSICGVTAISTGSFYSNTTTITFTTNVGATTFTSGAVATATAQLSGLITFAGAASSGTGAKAASTLTFTSVNVPAGFGGSGYQPGDVIEILGGTANATFQVNAGGVGPNGDITNVTLIQGGSGYTNLVSCATRWLSGPSAGQVHSGAIASGLGILESINMTNSGTLYNSPVSVTVTGGATSATATAQTDVFALQTTIGNGRGGYFDPSPSGQGSASGATGGLVVIPVNASGSGYDNPISVNITTPSTPGATNSPATAIAGTTGLDLNLSGASSTNIGVKITPSGGVAFHAFLNAYMETSGNGAVNLDVGSNAGSSIYISPFVFNNQNSASIRTTGSGGITLKATSLTSTVTISSGNKIYSSGAGADITIQGGTNARSGAGAIIGNGSIIQTDSANISFTGSSSSVLLSGTGEVLLISKTGNISIAGTLDNFPASSPTNVSFSTIGNVSILGFIGFYNGRIGAITLSGDGTQGINNLTFGLLNTPSTIVAQRLTINGSNDAIRGDINVYGSQDYANGTQGFKGLYIETLSGFAQTINFAGAVTVTQTTGDINDAIVYLDGNLNGSLVLAKGLSTTGQLTILDMGTVTVGNTTTSSTVTSGVGTIDFNSPVVLAGNSVFVANGAITFGKAITNIGTARNLNIRTTAAVTFADLGNNAAPLGTVTIENASSALSILGATSIVDVAGLVTAVRLAGPIDISAPTSQFYRGNLTLRTNNTIKTGAMNLANLGNVILGTTGTGTLGEISILGSVSNILSNFIQEAGTKVLVGSSTGGVVAFSNVNGASTGFSFASPVSLVQSMTITGSSGTNISFLGSIDSDSVTRSMTLSTSNGQISFSGNIGSTTSLGTVDISANNSGKVVFNVGATAVTTSGGLKVTGNAVVQSTTGTTFTETVSDIQFVNDLSGGSPLTSDVTFVTPGNLSFGSFGQGATGVVGSLKKIIITGSNPASFTSGAINAESLTTNAGIRVVGSFTVSGSQTYTDAGGTGGDNDVSVNAGGNITMGIITNVDEITLNNSSGAGTITLNNTLATGAATFNHGGTLQFNGSSFVAKSFSETSVSGGVTLGTGALSAGVTIQVTGVAADILFTRPVLINDAAILKGNGFGSDITFANTLRSVGNKNLTINGIQGNILFQNNVGDNSQALGNILITSGSPELLQSTGSVLNALSLVVSSSNPIFGNIDFSPTAMIFTGGSGLTLSTDHNGHVLTLSKDSPGTGYVTGDIVSIDNGTGATALVTADVTTGAITGLQLLTSGTGYTGGSFIGLTNVSGSGTGAGGTVTITANTISNILLNTVNLSSAGSFVLNSAVNDTAQLLGNISNANGVDQNGAIQVTLGSSSSSGTFAIGTAGLTGLDFEGDIILQQNSDLTSGGGMRIGGTIDSFSNTDPKSITLKSTSSGLVQTDREIGLTNILKSFTADATNTGFVTIQDTDTVDSIVAVLTQNGITITGNLNLVESETNLVGGSGNILVSGNISGTAGSDIIFNTSAGTISVNGSSGIGTSTITMGDVLISNTSSSLSITGAVYAQSLVTSQTLAGQIQVLGSQTITNNVQLRSNAGPILVSNISTNTGNIDLQVSGSGAVTVGALNAGINTPADITIRHGNTLTFNGSLTGKSFTEDSRSLGVIVISNSVAGTPVTFTVSGTDSGFEFINAVQLKENLTINSNSKVAFDSTLDTEVSATTKNITINVLAGTDRDVIFSNNLGSNRILGNITITGTNDIDAGTNTISALSLTAITVDVGADTGSINLLGTQLYSSSTGLALTATGDINVGQITTTNSGSVIFNNKNKLNLLGNIDANGRLTQTDVTGGTTTFVNMGDINSASGSINIQSSGGFAVTFNGNISLITNTTIQTNGAGAINLGTSSANTLKRNSGVTSALLLNVNAIGTGVVTLNSAIGGGGFELGTLNVSSGQLISIGSQSIETLSGGQIYTAPTTKLTSDLALTSGPGSILFTGNIDGSGSLIQDLSIINTSGNFTVTGNLGTQNVQLGDISGSGLFSVALGSSFAVNSIRAKSISLTSIVNNIDINTLSQVYQNSVNLNAGGNITTGATTAATGTISLTAAGNITENGLITSGAGGTITLDHGGLLVLAGDVTSTSTFTVTSGVNSSINVGTSAGTLATNDPVDITVATGNFILGRNVTLVNGLYVRTNATGGNVTFSSLVDSANATAKNLIIDSKGLVTFSGNLGSLNRLGTIVINGTSGYQLTGLTASGTITAGSLSSGVVANDINLTFDQDYNLGGINGGLNLTTTTSVAKIGDINIGNLVTTNGAGLTLKNSGAVTFASSITIDGAIAQTSGVTGSAGGAITAVPQVIFGSTIGNIVTLTSNTAGISFGSKATMLQDTTLIGGTNGNVVFSGNLDSGSTARSLVVTTKGTTDSTTFNGTVGATNGLGSIVVNSRTITVNGGGVKTLNSGGQIYNGSLSLGSGTQSLVADGGGSLDFRNNVNGPGNLTMTTSSNISFANNIGNSNALGAILITGATPTSLNITGTVLAQSLKTVSSVNGTINIGGNQTYTGVGGLLLSTLGLGDITVGQITSQNAASTIQLDHTGNLNLNGDIYDSGAFNQNSLGSGSIFIGVTNTPAATRNIQVANSDIDFDASVILNSNLSLLTAKTAAAVTFNKVINSATLASPVNLKVTSTGKLTFVDSIGDQNPLGAIDTSNASLAGIDANGILTNPNAVIKASSFTSGNVSGDVNILTPQFYNSAIGLNLGTTGVGSDIILGSITTTNSGIVRILNSDSLKLQGILVLDGTFTQTSSDTVNADVEIGSSGNSFSLTTNQKNISFQAPITLIANGVFATGGNGNVTFSGKIDSSSLSGTSQAKSLTVTNTTGIVTLGSSVGTGTNSQLGSIDLTSGSIILGGASLGTINLNTIGSNGQKFNGPISLDSNAVLDASNTGSVLISQTLNSGQFSNKSLTINNTQGVQVNNRIGGVSGVTALSALNITANTTVLNTDSVKTSGAGQIYDTILTLGNSAITLSADTGLVQFGLSVDIGTQNMTVSADQIEITSTASIKSTSSILTLQPGTLFRDVEIGATVSSAASLSLTAAELGRLTDGFAGITIGRVDSKSNLVVAGPLTSGQVKDPFTLTTGGNLNVLNAIAATNNASLSLIDPTGTINLNSTISTEGQSILVNGTTQIGVSGGNIFTTGNSNSFPTGGNITLTSTAGSVVGNGLLILDSGTSGTITSNSTILMSGGITITNSGGSTFNSPVTVGSVNINGSTSGKDVTFNGALNATTFNTASAGFNLKLLSGGSVSGATSLTNTGTITLGDNTSDTLTFAGGLIATSSSQLNLAGTIATTNMNMTLGNSVLTTSATLRSGSGIIITGSVTGGTGVKLSLQNNSATGPVNLAGNVTLNQLETFAGLYAVNLTGSSNLISGAATTLNN